MSKANPRSNLKKKATQSNVPSNKRHQTIRVQEPEKVQETNEDFEDADFDANINSNKPKDQVQLTQKELEEDIPSRMLTPKNPQAPSNVSTYSFKERVFRKFEPFEQVVIHFSLEGSTIHKDSQEAKTQEDIEEERSNLIKEHKKTQQQTDPNAPAEDIDTIKKQLRNKFNYNEHQAQTINEPIRERGVSTEPPPSQRISKEITLWEIYDANMEDIQKKMKEESKGGAPAVAQPKNEKQESSLYSAGFRRCLKIMERMTVLNEQNEKYKEYKYMWTQGDFLDQKEGIIYPIWKFHGEKQRRKMVTSICWNPRYSDLFAVGLGSYEFSKQKTGLICIYSLKNTTNPEYSFSTEAGVMTLDFHPKSAALLAVGLYDGTVMVFDIRSKYKKPIYQSTVRTNKHTDPVWQVMWNPDNSKNYNFYSISSDGRVVNWVLMKNKLEPEEVIKLKLVGKTSDEEASLIGYAGGLCFDFNKVEPHIFIVGTEEGKIHQCSRAYSGQYQETYEGHLLSVYKVRFNNFHPRVFISASADWTAKIWDLKHKYPIMSFDLGIAVTDAMWAPYSSTVFATSTLEKAYLYDLHVDKYTKLADAKPVKQPKLTNIAFNNHDPILLVGDSHGGVTLTKLSPNLTRRGKYEKIDDKDKDKKDEKKPMEIKLGDKKKDDDRPERTPEQIEMDKMEEFLSMATKFDKDDI